MRGIQSHLARHVPKTALTKGEFLAMAARAWRDHKILLLRPDQLANEIDQQMVRSLGDRLYGKRNNG